MKRSGPDLHWSRVPFDAVAAVPWRNGGGVTRELLAWPNAHDWACRISVAEVAASGPFSAYPGVQRWFAVLSGEGVVLDVAGQAHRLDAASAPLRFAGDAPTTCELRGGATRDFNLMLRTGQAHGTLRRVQGTLVQDVVQCVNKSKIIAIYSESTGADVLFDDENLQLPPQTLAWAVVPRAGQLRVTSDAALWLEVVQ
ncbi:MAG: HutD family protein [Burkholderiales bacterium]|nr:HutD family protein [Burkholderiales bacterium]